MNPLAAARNRVKGKFLKRCAELGVRAGQAIPEKEITRFPMNLDVTENRVAMDAINELVQAGYLQRGKGEYDLSLTEKGDARAYPQADGVSRLRR